MADANAKISVHSLSDLKNTSDDAIPTYLNSLKFIQSHTLSDVRLVLGYTAFAICAATFYWDYKLGFDSTKYYTAAAVALYALLNSVLTFWIWGVEKGKVYVGTSPSGEKIEIATATKKHVPVYNVTVTTYAKPGGKQKTVEIKSSFTKWFDNVGHFVPLPFQRMLAEQVPMIAKADSRLGIGGEKKAILTSGLEEAMAAMASGSVTGVAGQTPARKGKGRNKA